MISQESYFFESAGVRLLGVNFKPTAPVKDIGFVVCNGFGSDYYIFRSHVTRFCRALATQGYPAFRFDYTGYGDSEGDFAEASPEVMANDLRGAIAELKRKSGCKRIGLAGMRFGATLCALVADGRDDVAKLALWEPIVDADKYLMDGLRQTIAMQTVLFREVRIERTTIIENVLAGKPSSEGGYNWNVTDEGFPLGPALVRGMQALNLSTSLPTIAAETLVLHVRKNPGKAPKPIAELVKAWQDAGVRCTLDVAVEQSPPWKDERFYMAHSPDVFAKTLSWLEASDD